MSHVCMGHVTHMNESCAGTYERRNKGEHMDQSASEQAHEQDLKDAFSHFTWRSIVSCCSVCQCVAECRRVLQCITVCCSVWLVIRISVLQ